MSLRPVPHTVVCAGVSMVFPFPVLCRVSVVRVLALRRGVNVGTYADRKRKRKRKQQQNSHGTAMLFFVATLRKGGKRAQKKEFKKQQKAAEREAVEGAAGAGDSPPEGDRAIGPDGRRGPSGQKLKGPEQKTTAVAVEPPVADNPFVTPALEAENVHRVYDAIADHWNHTRYKAWPRVEGFIRSLPFGSVVADLGCGNGKNLPHVKAAGGFAVASDMCAPLVRIAAEEHGACGLVADCLVTPFRSGGFDAAISIAVLHHLSTEPRRVQALREAARVLRPGGLFLVYCWSYEQDDQLSRSRHRFVAQDVLVPWSFRTPGIKKVKGQEKAEAEAQALAREAAAEADPGSADWQEQPPVCQRYCHVYCEGELDKLLAQVPELEVVEIYFDTGNWCAISRRRHKVAEVS
ncbi:unnamed protein product [Polarella glacialis]|uniref:Methyltransferase type 11 domain-containing protein n=1 Tax=Polarella glacialis TaxID=89957 RepID=A0A813EA28_POLGL|nr:unnamed protein product [Polarella glacialis]